MLWYGAGTKLLSNQVHEISRSDYVNFLIVGTAVFFYARKNISD